MNQVLDTIQKRRSHRKYKAQPLSKEQIDTLITAALASPSALNRQSWHFSVVQQQQLLGRIHDAAKAVALQREKRSARYDDEQYHIFYHAPCVIFLSADTSSPYAQIDCGIAVQNLALAAESMGLGSVILAMPKDAFAGNEHKALEEALGFPNGYTFVIAIAIGIPLDDKSAHEIKDGKVSYIL